MRTRVSGQLQSPCPGSQHTLGNDRWDPLPPLRVKGSRSTRFCRNRASSLSTSRQSVRVSGPLVSFCTTLGPLPWHSPPDTEARGGGRWQGRCRVFTLQRLLGASVGTGRQMDSERGQIVRGHGVGKA